MLCADFNGKLLVPSQIFISFCSVSNVDFRLVLFISSYKDLPVNSNVNADRTIFLQKNP